MQPIDNRYIIVNRCCTIKLEIQNHHTLKNR